MGDSKAKVGLSFMYDCPAGLKDVSLNLSILYIMVHGKKLNMARFLKYLLESGTSRQSVGREAT